MRRAVLVALALALAVLPAGCDQAPDREDYCEAVKDRQRELSEVLGSGGPDVLLRALPIFQDLAEQAPEDLRDEWKQVVFAIERLQQALDDAGVDAATYDRDNPPPDLSQSEKDRIDDAAVELANPQTRAALAGVEQHARDVCNTPLQV